MDNFQALKGQEIVKRAMEIAVAGNHTLLIKDVNNDPTPIEKAYNSLCFGVDKEYYKQLYIFHPCPCGWLESNKENLCSCSVDEIRKHQIKIKTNLLDYDIRTTTEKYKWNDYTSSDTEPVDKIVSRIKKIKTVTNEIFTMEKNAKELLKMFINKIGTNQTEVESLLNVAWSIAKLEQSNIIKAEHISESIQYKITMELF